MIYMIPPPSLCEWGREGEPMKPMKKKAGEGDIYIDRHCDSGTLRLTSPITCHLTTPLCSFSYYETPKRHWYVAAGGLVINRVVKLN